MPFPSCVVSTVQRGWGRSQAAGPRSRSPWRLQRLARRVHTGAPGVISLEPQRQATVTEIAGLVEMLCHDEAGFVTAQCFSMVGAVR